MDTNSNSENTGNVKTKKPRSIKIIPFFTDYKVYTGLSYISGRDAVPINKLIFDILRTVTLNKFKVELSINDSVMLHKELSELYVKAKTSSIADYIEWCCSKHIEAYISTAYENLKPKHRGD